MFSSVMIKVKNWLGRWTRNVSWLNRLMVLLLDYVSQYLFDGFFLVLVLCLILRWKALYKSNMFGTRYFNVIVTLKSVQCWS